jgi:hypothetical protein
VQSARIAERSRAVRSASPFRCLGTVAAVAATWRRRAASSFLGIGTGELVPSVHTTRYVLCWWLRRRSLFGVGLVLTLLGDLLLVGSLLRKNHFSNLVKRFNLNPGFVDHVVHFHNARENRNRWSSTRVLMELVAIPAGEIRNVSAGCSNLGNVNTTTAECLAM